MAESDIDITIAITGSTQVAGELNQVETAARGVDDAAGEAGAGGSIGKMAEKFGLMSRGLSVMSPQLAMAARETRLLTMLADPMAALAVGVVAAGFAVFKLAQAAHRFEEADLAAEIQKITDATEISKAGYDRLYRAILDGKDKIMQQDALISGMASEQFKIAEKEKDARVSSIQKNITDLLTLKQRAQEAISDGLKAMPENVTLGGLIGYGDSLDPKDVIKKTSQSIATLTTRIDQENGALVTLMQTLAPKIRLEKEDNEEIKKSIKGNSEKSTLLKLWTGFRRLANDELKKELALEKEIHELDKIAQPVNTGMTPDQANAINGVNGVGQAARDAIDPLHRYGIEVDSLAARINELTGASKNFSLEASAGAIVVKHAIEGDIVHSYDAYAAALDKTVSLNAIFAGGFDRTMRNIAASAIKSIGEQSAVKGAMAFADGIVDLATYQWASAELQFESAALYGAIALAAGVAAGATSVNAAGGGTGGGGSSGTGGGGGSTAGQGGDTIAINVTVIGTLDAMQAQDLHEQLARAQSSRRL